jgi:NAD(P)-dependent dehydrogenase (short-subunit alcohol dehydrogenase family)
MLDGLSGKTAIVTGGATKIGAAVVEAFAAAGTRVVIADTDAENGNVVAARRSMSTS